MHEAHGWFLTANVTKIAIAVWIVAVILFGFWRSRGAAGQDAIRESGPIL